MDYFDKMKNFIKELEIDRIDYSFFVLYSFIIIYYIAIGSFTSLTIGGLLLVFGAWLVYKGEIFVSIFLYLTADVMWVINAFHQNDYSGAFFIFLGMLLGILATFKMQLGSMAKNLRIKKM